MLGAQLLGMGWRVGLVLGGALAMSSTAIVSKMLSERLELESPHGRDIIGVLLFQDLAVVPLLVVIPALDYMQVGESYDLIIGVDGSRVTNFLDFQDRMRDLQPGELVYLSVVRNGKRLQVTLSVPSNIQQATN